MRWVVLVLAGVLVGCGSKDQAGSGGGDAVAPFPAAQKIVDGVASGHPSLKRLTLHAVPTGKKGCMQVASTMAARRGKPSDPEDLEAMSTGQEIVLDEEGAVDVTVPIMMVDGKPTAIAGVTVTLAEGVDREEGVGEARAIAEELEKEIGAAGKPVW